MGGRGDGGTFIQSRTLESFHHIQPRTQYSLALDCWNCCNDTLNMRTECIFNQLFDCLNDLNLILCFYYLFTLLVFYVYIPECSTFTLSSHLCTSEKQFLIIMNKLPMPMVHSCNDDLANNVCYFINYQLRISLTHTNILTFIHIHIHNYMHNGLHSPA